MKIYLKLLLLNIKLLYLHNKLKHLLSKTILQKQLIQSKIDSIHLSQITIN
jgi:hypothetical protein